MTDARNGQDVPDDWVWTTCSEIADVIGGLTKNRKRSAYPIRIPYLRVANVYANELRLDEIKEIGIRESELERVLVKRGDLLVVEGNGSIDQIGRVAMWKGAIEPCAHQNHLIKVRPIDGVESDYLLYWLLSPGGRDHIVSVSSSTSGLHTLSLSKVKAIPVPLAPPAEQRRIVDALEAHFADLDGGVAALEAARRQLDRYRRSVLKAAVEGALTSSWREAHPDAEPASALLERILVERRERWEAEQIRKYEAKGKTPPSGWRNRYKPPARPETDELAELPKGWVWASVEQVSDESSVTYGVIKLGEHKDDGVPTLRSSNVRPLRIDLKGVKKIAPDLSSQYSRTILKGGEVALTVRGTLGGIASIPTSMAGYNVSREVAVVDPITGLDSRYLACTIASAPIMNWLLARARGVAYTGINIATLKALPLPLPPVKEQAAIVEAVEERLSVAEAVAAEIDRQLVRAARLRRSLLQEAFAGRLVPQDPSDAPASALLARIRGIELAEDLEPGTQTALEFGA